MVSAIQLGIRGDIARRNVAEQAIVEMLLLGGWAYELAAGQRRLAAEHCLAALKLWIDKGLEFASDSDGHRRYDPAEVMNFMKWTSLNGSDDFWTERFVPTGRRFVTDNLGDDAADAPQDRGFGVGFARRFNLAGRATAWPLPPKRPAATWPSTISAAAWTPLRSPASNPCSNGGATPRMHPSSAAAIRHRKSTC